MSRALTTFPEDVLAQVVSAARAEAMERSEKVLGPAKWLLKLKRRTGVPGGNRTNKIWSAIATAPAGFCHPRSSMLGSLLTDLEQGYAFDAALGRWRNRMHPLRYQRPQAAPTRGNIARAEEIVKRLGLERSLSRRFARQDECVMCWAPTPESAPEGKRGVFAHLEPNKRPDARVCKGPITWVKFAATVLPGAKRLEVAVPDHGNFCALLTAVHADAPPILQWDDPSNRNPVSWYVYNGGSPAVRWGLTPGWVEVCGITRQPSQWSDADKFQHQGCSVIFLLPGAKDQLAREHGLFPEILKPELREIRSVIEAHSKQAALGDADDVAAGLRFPGGGGLQVCATDDTGLATVYNLDRWD